MSKLKIVGIASLPERVDCLEDTINSLYNQVDLIIVGLNNYKKVPNFLQKEKIRSYLLDNKLGDAAKFYKVDEYKGHYYFSCDDDIIYSPTFISKLTEVDHPVVGIHGADMKFPCKNYYKDRVTYHGLHSLAENREVDIVGSGAVKIDLEKINLSVNDFPTPNMADVYLSDICRSHGIKPIIVQRETGDLYTYNPKMKGKYTIYSDLSIKPTPIHCEIINKWQNS